MTRKHFERAAEIVREMRDENTTERERYTVASAFAVLFSGYNPRFDVSRFFAACEVTP